MKDEVINIWVSAIKDKLGQDPGDNKNEEYKNELYKYVDYIKENAPQTDQFQIMNTLAEKITSQKQISYYLKPKVKLDEKFFQDTNIYGKIGEGILLMLDRHPDEANDWIDFILNEYSNDHAKTIFDRYLNNLSRVERNLIQNEMDHNVLKYFHKNYWHSPIEIRAIFMKRIISSLSEGNDNKNSWEKVFEILSEKLLSNENTNEVKTAKNILHSYIKSLEPYERSIILSGIMVSSKQGRKSKDFNTGKALKTFIESMNDPALVKLGQAISSYPGTPESIRKEMMELKSNANKPSRWEIFELIENNKIIPEKVKKEIEYLGEVLGSASYWFIVKTLKKNNNKSALGFLRYKVKEKADYGFKVLEKTVEDLLEKAKKMKKKEKNDTISLCNSLSKMIKSSKEMAEIETNVEIGHEQWQKAHDIYNGQLFKANNNTTFKIHVAKWNSYSQTHKDMEAVNGIHFNDLPEETEEEKTLKNQIAKIYAQIEFTQLFKGEEIDYDRHGAQMKVDIISDKDEKFITINLFDHGSMVLEHPGSKEKKVFGKVFSKMIVNSLL
jgi:hypothetical protein